MEEFWNHVEENIFITWESYPWVTGPGLKIGVQEQISRRGIKNSKRTGSQQELNGYPILGPEAWARGQGLSGLNYDSALSRRVYLCLCV